MLDLIAYSFLTIDPKLGVTLPNFTESDKVVLEQVVEDFHVAYGGTNIE
jgi:hypothetical protein